MSSSDNPYQPPAEALGIPTSYEQERWTHSWTDTKTKNGEVGLILENDALTINVPQKQLVERVPRATHFERLTLARRFLLLPKPNNFCLMLPAEVQQAVDDWRGPSTREWLRHDLIKSRNNSFLMVGLIALNLILTISFENGGLQLLYPISSGLFLLSLLIYLSKGLLAPIQPHWIWFFVDILGYAAFIGALLFDRSTLGIMTWMLIGLGLFVFWGLLHPARVHLAKRGSAP